MSNGVWLCSVYVVLADRIVAYGILVISAKLLKNADTIDAFSRRLNEQYPFIMQTTGLDDKLAGVQIADRCMGGVEKEEL